MHDLHVISALEDRAAELGDGPEIVALFEEGLGQRWLGLGPQQGVERPLQKITAGLDAPHDDLVHALEEEIVGRGPGALFLGLSQGHLAQGRHLAKGDG